MKVDKYLMRKARDNPWEFRWIAGEVKDMLRKASYSRSEAPHYVKEKLKYEEVPWEDRLEIGKQKASQDPLYRALSGIVNWIRNSTRVTLTYSELYGEAYYPEIYR